jgi:hypothetical protein
MNGGSPSLQMDAIPHAALTEYLDADTRPTFVLDATVAGKHHDLDPVYINNTLLANTNLLENVRGRYSNFMSIISWSFTYRSFRNWAVDGGETDWTNGGYLFKAHIWTRFVVSDRWIVLSATEPSEPKAIQSPTTVDIAPAHITADLWPKPTDHFSGYASGNIIDSSLETGVPTERLLNSLLSKTSLPQSGQNFDWTGPHPEKLTGYAKTLRDVDWANTPLGLVDSWPDDLRTWANFVITDPEPSVLFWSKDNLMIYNEHYIPVVQPKHPECLGSNVHISLPQYNEFLVGIFETIRRTRKTVTMPSIPIFLPNHEDQLEEKYFSSRLYPIIGPSCEVIGIYERNTFITDQVQLQRR